MKIPGGENCRWKDQEVQRILQSALLICWFRILRSGQSRNQSLADMEGLYFSMAKAGSLREQANGGNSDRRGKDQDIRICSTEVSGFHQIVKWEPVEELLTIKRNVAVLGIKF